MIIFLYGQDSYRSRQKLNEIIKHYTEVHKSGLNLARFDVKKTKFHDFSDKLKITSMFDEKKLIILKNVFFNLKFQEELLKEIENLSESKDIVIIYEPGSVDKRNKLFKTLKKEIKSQEFTSLTGQRLKTWIQNEFEKYQTTIDPKALEILTEHVGDDLWRIVNEIKKLVSYRNKERIEKKDIELLVRPKIETDIFKTIDAIAQKNKKQALRLLHKHLEKGDSPLYLLSMIGFQFRNLLIVKDFIENHKPYNVILKKSGLHPFVVKKTYHQSQQFTLEELKKTFNKIFKIDLDIKTGKIKPELALEILITQI